MMYKLLLVPAVLLLAAAACSDNPTQTTSPLSLAPSNSAPLVASDLGPLDIEGVEEIPPLVMTRAQVIAQDPIFQPDTVYAEDYLVTDGNASGPGVMHVTKLDSDTGEVIGDYTYDFSSLMTGDHVVIFEDGGVAIWCDYDVP